MLDAHVTPSANAGGLRLRGCFASRTSRSAQNDKVLGNIWICLYVTIPTAMAWIESIKSRLGWKPKEPPLISVVLLLSSPMRLEEEVIEAAIVRAWGRGLRKDENEYVVNKPPVGFIRFDGMVLLINNISKPYVPQEYREKAVREFRELRQRKIVLEHKAWFSLDLMSPENPTGKSKSGCYRRMCSLAAELVDENCMGVSFPETGHLRPFDMELKSALRSDDPLRQTMRLEKAPVLVIEQDDPALIAAVTEARRRWPEFLDAFQRRNEAQMFGVKAPFRDGENVEWMWVSVSAIENDVIQGRVENDPLNLKNVREGDVVRIPASTIGDWIYNHGKTTVGGFSTKITGQ